MATLSHIINAVKDGYVEAADWVSRHPHTTIWAALVAIAIAAAF